MAAKAVDAGIGLVDGSKVGKDKAIQSVAAPGKNVKNTVACQSHHARKRAARPTQRTRNLPRENGSSGDAAARAMKDRAIRENESVSSEIEERAVGRRECSTAAEAIV